MATATKKAKATTGGVDELTPLATKSPEMKLGAEAEAEYRRLAKELSKLGHLSDLNRQCLVNYCEAWGIAADALDEIRDDGVCLENPENGNKYSNPALNAWSMARKTMAEEAKNLGMTPASLQSIRSAKAPTKKKNDGGPSKFLT